MARYRKGEGFHFAAVPFELLDDEDADAFVIATYASIRSFADFGSDEGASISDGRAAKRAGCSARHFRRCRVALQQMGWLEWTTVPYEHGRVNVYTIHAIRRPEPDGGAVCQAAPMRTVRPTTKSQIPR